MRKIISLLTIASVLAFMVAPVSARYQRGDSDCGCPQECACEEHCEEDDHDCEEECPVPCPAPFDPCECPSTTRVEQNATLELNTGGVTFNKAISAIDGAEVEVEHEGDVGGLTILTGNILADVQQGAYLSGDEVQWPEFNRDNYRSSWYPVFSAKNTEVIQNAYVSANTGGVAIEDIIAASGKDSEVEVEFCGTHGETIVSTGDIEASVSQWWEAVGSHISQL